MVFTCVTRCGEELLSRERVFWMSPPTADLETGHNLYLIEYKKVMTVSAFGSPSAGTASPRAELVAV